MTRADTAWMRDAACARSTHRGLPWLDDTRTVPTVVVDLMADVCAGCPVLGACTGYVSAEPAMSGFWAGADRDPAALADLERDELGGAA